MKRLFDLIVTIPALLLLLPLCSVIALLILFDSPGPVLFRQRRLGRHGRVFRIFKFRTMQQHAAEVRNEDGSAYCGKDDPRITPIGHLLRATSLDELPQLWNVLQGDMSLVGPRPDQADQIRFYSEEDQVKLRVRPGLTGLAQINGRNQLQWQERRRLDCQYVRDWSFLLDLQIIWRTIPYVLQRRDVHSEVMHDKPHAGIR